MTEEEFIDKLSIDGELVPSRCTFKYLEKHNLLEYLNIYSTESFGSISERIKYIKYGGGYCKVCGIRTKLHVSGKGFSEYCKEHFHEPKKGKKSSNRKDVDIEYVKKLYLGENKTILEISKILGNISNVSLTKKLKEANVELRLHKDNQRGRSPFLGKIKILSLENNKDEIIQKYNEGRSLDSLAKEYSCNYQTVRKFLILNNVSIFASPNDRTQIEYKILDLYSNQNKTISQITRILNVPGSYIGRKLISNGIQRRDRSENQKINANRSLRVIIDRTELVERYKEGIHIVELAKNYNCDPETIRRFLIQEGVDRFHKRTYIEYIIAEILKKSNIFYLANHRKLLKNFEVDFYIPDKNLAIEVNGVYFHSYYRGAKDKDYHHSKYKLCLEKGVKLFQFWENDLNSERKILIIESMIRNSLGLTSNRIYARNCTIENVSRYQSDQFLESNHIQGKGSNAYSLGLFYQTQLVSLITYIKSSEGTIITRFCNLINHNIVGGFSRLLSHLPDGLIKTYSHNDISNGDLYKKNGFELLQQNIYDLWYTDYKNIYNRQKFMKSKIKDNLDFYDEETTELQNMFNNGYDAIFKSGTKTWIKKKGV